MVTVNKYKSNKIALYHTCCQTIVKHLHSKLLEEKAKHKLNFGTTKVSKRLQNYTNIGTMVLQRLLKCEDIPPPNVTIERSKEFSVNEEEMKLIRPVIVSLILQKNVPTVESINNVLKEQNKDWNHSDMTLNRAMHKLGFKFNSHRSNYYDHLHEEPRNVLLRTNYLRDYMIYYNENREFVYLDETWYNKNDQPKKTWNDGTTDTSIKMPPSGVKRC